MQDRERSPVERSVRRPVQARKTGPVASQLLALGEQLAGLLARGQVSHDRMGFGVITDSRPHPQLPPKRPGKVAQLEPDLKERRGDVQALELGKQPGRVRPWSVVEGNRDLASLGATGADERLTSQQPVDRGVLTRATHRALL